MMDLLDEKPKGKLDYDHWINDGTILIRGNIIILFGKLSCKTFSLQIGII